MELFTMPRASGKTSAMLRWLVNDLEHRAVVVASVIEARVLRERLVDEHGLSFTAASRAVIPTAESHDIRGRQVDLAIDDVDRVLTALLGAPVAIGALT